MIDSCNSHCQTSIRCCDSRGHVYRRPPSRRLTLLHRLWIQIASHKQDGCSMKGDILASLLHSSRKWRNIVHIYIQSMCNMFYTTKFPSTSAAL